MRITILMPNPPSIVCGIADHSLLLGEALEGLGSTVDYLAFHRSAHGPDESNVHCWDGSAKGLRNMVRHLGTEVLWVQYSGYGYSRKGIPFGLAHALNQIRKSESAPILVVCMHETHANLARLGWRAFLIQRLQQATAGWIARAADVAFATVEVNLKRCVDEYGVSRESISLLPIASNIPDVRAEHADRITLRERLRLPPHARIAAIFGLWATQVRTLKLFRKDLDDSLNDGRIDHVLAIGGEVEQPPDGALEAGERSLNGNLTVLGPAPGKEVARILRCCDIGLIPTPPDYVRKSGVAAAFAAAHLELWMKNEHCEVVVEKNPAPFPEWEELASIAHRKIVSHIENNGHTRR